MKSFNDPPLFMPISLKKKSSFLSKQMAWEGTEKCDMFKLTFTDTRVTSS